MKKKPVQRFLLCLYPQQLAQLRALQEETGVPVSYAIRKAVDAYLATLSPETVGKGARDEQRDTAN